MLITTPLYEGKYSKYILPAAGLVGAGLLGYGGYKMYDQGQSALDWMNKQTENMKRMAKEAEERAGVTGDSFVDDLSNMVNSAKP